MEDIAEKIRREVSRALDSAEFDSLNQAIKDTVESALTEARQQLDRWNTAANAREGGRQPGGWNTATNARETGQQPGGWNAATNAREAGQQPGGWNAATNAREAGQQPVGWNAAANAREAAQQSGVRNTAANVRPGGREIRTDWRWSDMPKQLRIRVKWKGKISGVLMSVLGGIGSFVFGIFTLLVLVTLLATGESWSWGMLVLSGVLTAASAVLLVLGQQRCGRVERLRRYVEEMKRLGRSCCELKRLSQISGRSEQFVLKDMKKILMIGMLPEARMDDEGTCLMLDDEAYRRYCLERDERQARDEDKQREEARRERDRAENRWHGKQAYHKGSAGLDGFADHETESEADQDGGETEQKPDEPGGSGNPAVDEAIARGEEYMAKLDGLREALPQSCEMTGKLLRLDQILERLFGTLRKYPDQLDELERFMEYYLPTTVKLVKAYQEFTAVEFPGDNIKKAKTEIEATMDTINGAFEKLLDDMYEDTAFDVMTDASVLQTMLAREGLTEKDFQ